jgi:hypothetical protein
MNAWSFWITADLVTLSLWVGCIPKAPTRPPTAKPPPASLVEGIWENPGHGSTPMKMIFSAGGRLTFQGALEFYNPGQWEYRPDIQELILTLPEADDSKLQVFQMYVGDGVKAFDRERKEITYHFDDQTQELNVGGWVYSKVGGPTAPPAPAAEPILK